MKLMLALAGLAMTLSSAAQDQPQDIERRELPKKAVCVVCSANGEGHGEEKPAAGVRYRGKTYYFCAAGEVSGFKAEPDSYLPPVLPRPAPALSLRGLDGKSASLDSHKGKVVLIDFWATWCAPCVKVMPDLQKLHDRLSARGLVVLGVSIDEEGETKVKPFVEKRKFTYPMAFDGSKQWKAWGVRAIPAMFLVDKEGRIVRQWTGKADKKEVEAAIQGLLK